MKKLAKECLFCVIQKRMAHNNYPKFKFFLNWALIQANGFCKEFKIFLRVNKYQSFCNFPSNYCNLRKNVDLNSGLSFM